MRENRQSGLEGGEDQLNDPSLPLSLNETSNIAAQIVLRQSEFSRIPLPVGMDGG